MTIIDCYLMSIINKKNPEYSKYSNDNEKYLYANYLVSLRKIKKAQKILTNNNIFMNFVNDTSRDSNKNTTVLDNKNNIAKTLILANIKIDVSNVKYIQISTKNDTIVIELDKNNNDNFINYDLGKIDSLISAISILMNVLNIH